MILVSPLRARTQQKVFSSFAAQQKSDIAKSRMRREVAATTKNTPTSTKKEISIGTATPTNAIILRDLLSGGREEASRLRSSNDPFSSFSFPWNGWASESRSEILEGWGVSDWSKLLTSPIALLSSLARWIAWFRLLNLKGR